MICPACDHDVKEVCEACGLCEKCCYCGEGDS
jgi:hypothetical protein